MWLLPLVCGVIFGFAFGLTGVGSIFAVPMLVYAIGLPPHRAVCVAMIAVAFLSLLSTALRWRRSEIELRAGGLIAVMGIAGAPIGAWIGRFLTGKSLMLVFACVVTVIALRMIIRGAEPAIPGSHLLARKGANRFALTVAGLTTGILAGLLGIGGLLIIPSLVMLAGIEIHRAIATSVSIVFFIGISAIISHFLAGQRVPVIATALFVGSGAVAMIAGAHLGKRISDRQLQTVFGIAMFAVAVIILLRSSTG